MNILVSGLFSAADSYGKDTAIFEIILMLLVAFILGYLLRYLLGGKSTDDVNWKVKYEDLDHKYTLSTNQLSIYETENKRLKTELDECNKGTKMGFAAVPPEERDNLKKVEGIGPKIEQLLFDGGVYTWEQLSQTDVSYIQKILDNAGPNYKVHNPATWPKQAELAAQGKWDELEKWQDELKGGRPS